MYVLADHGVRKPYRNLALRGDFAVLSMAPWIASWCLKAKQAHSTLREKLSAVPLNCAHGF